MILKQKELRSNVQVFFLNFSPFLLAVSSPSGSRSLNCMALMAGLTNSNWPFITFPGFFSISAASWTASRQTLSRGFLCVWVILNLMALRFPSCSGCCCRRCWAMLFSDSLTLCQTHTHSCRWSWRDLRTHSCLYIYIKPSHLTATSAV